MKEKNAFSSGKQDTLRKVNKMHSDPAACPEQRRVFRRKVDKNSGFERKLQNSGKNRKKLKRVGKLQQNRRKFRRRTCKFLRNRFVLLCGEWDIVSFFRKAGRHRSEVEAEKNLLSAEAAGVSDGAEQNPVKSDSSGGSRFQQKQKRILSK